jgi:transcriptional regulator GlxA family with amidase domain
VSLSAVTPELLDAAVRLLRLLAAPRDIPALAPLAEREILYRLLTGDQVATLRQIALGDRRMRRVGRAIEWIKRNYREPFRIETLAPQAAMSPSSLHAHFKTLTAMSPLQYQKQLRLQEARRLMLGQSMDAASAAYDVGYESPSQFSREYRRLFGNPPARDSARLKSSTEFMESA